MGDGLQLFTMGVWVVALAYLTSTIGIFVGVTSARKVRTATTAGMRWWWLIVASFVGGGVGVWLAQFLPMAGLSADGSTVRYDVGTIALSVFLAVAGVGAGLRIALPNFGGGTLGRTVTGALTVGLALVLVHFTIVESIRVRGEIEYNPMFAAAAVVLGLMVSVGFLWQVLNADSWPKRFASSAVAALGVMGVYFIGMLGVDIVTDLSVPIPDGFEVFTVLFPLFVVGLLFLTVPIVSVLMAPEREAAELETESVSSMRARSDGPDSARADSFR